MMTMETATKDSTKKSVNVGKTERWASMVGGAALAIFGMTRESLPGFALSLATGGYLFYRGKTGYDPLYGAMGVDTSKMIASVNIDESITINRRPEEVYRFWHNFENLPSFMEHLDSVKVLDERRSHWVASTPGGIKFEWDADMTEDIPNERISWQSLLKSDVQNQGSVEFKKALPENTTELKFKASYAIPGGIGTGASKLLEYITAKQLKKELSQFKSMIESGEILRAA